VALLAAGHNEAAVSALEELLRLTPGWAAARSYLGIAYLRCTRVPEARRELEDALRIAPRSFICLTKYAEFLARLGFYDQALARLDSALQGEAPDVPARLAAMELARFCKERAKGIYYRQTASPRLFRARNLLPRRHRQPAPAGAS
jgi:Tfp pilus assembly protein PilF